MSSDEIVIIAGTQPVHVVLERGARLTLEVRGEVVEQPPPPPPDPEPEVEEPPPPPPPPPPVLPEPFAVARFRAGETTLAVFGAVFARGDVPEGMAPVLYAGDVAIPTQVDAKRRHPDGSLRHGLITARLAEGVEYAWRAMPAAEAVALPTPGAGVVVRLVAKDGATADVPLLTSPSEPWRVGALIHERRVVVPVPPELVGGKTSARLIADVSEDVEGVVEVDAWIANDGALRLGGGPVECGLRVLVDGVQVAESPVRMIRQYSNAGGTAGNGGRVRVRRDGAPAPRRPMLIPDAEYLWRAGAIHRYDTSIAPAPSVETSNAAYLASPTWDAPGDARGLVRYFGTSGGRRDIGPQTAWVTHWLMTGSESAERIALGQAEAARTFPCHLWDDDRWVDAERYPRLWVDYRGTPKWTPGAAPASIGGLPDGQLPDYAEWQMDNAHCPEVFYVPYLLTGRRAYLDSMAAYACSRIMIVWTARAWARGDTLDWQTAEGVNMFRQSQCRGTAWSLRTVMNAAWAVPDDHTSRHFLEQTSAANMRFAANATSAWDAFMGPSEVRGIIPAFVYGPFNGLDARATYFPPWQHDMLLLTIAQAARQGHNPEDVRRLLEWGKPWFVGRFLNAHRGFNVKHGAAYLTVFRPDPDPVPPPPPGEKAQQPIPKPIAATWEEMAALQPDKPWEPGYYGRYAAAALSALIADTHLRDDPDAAAALSNLRAAGDPGMTATAYAADPTLCLAA